jgi:hypothetical protein
MFQFVLTILLVVYAVVAILALDAMPSARLRETFANSDIDNLYQVATASMPLTLLLGGAVVLFFAIFAAMMVPLAAAAHGANENAHPKDFFWGFGASFFGLFVVTVAVTVAYYWVGVDGAVSIYATQGIAWIMSAVFGERVDLFTRNTILANAPLIVFGFWLFCLQYAAAAQAYVSRRGSLEEERATMVVPQADPEGLRDLRKSRER